MIRSGFVPYLEKSVWVPTSALDCLGFPIDLFQGFLFVQGIKLKRVLSDIDSLILRLIVALPGNCPFLLVVLIPLTSCR